MSYYPAKFGCHRDCGSGDLMVLDCHVVLQDHVTKRSSNFIDGSHLRQVTILPSLVSISTVVLWI